MEESKRILADYVQGNATAAREILDRYSHRLLALAAARLSTRLQGRVDPEDIVQSVYRSFFRRADQDDIILKRTGDLWRLLAGMTVKKVLGRVEFEFAAKRSPDNEQHDSEVLSALDREPTSDEIALLLDQVDSFMTELRLRDRKILERRIRGESVSTIGSEVGLAEATVRRIIRRTESTLTKRLLEG